MDRTEEFADLRDDVDRVTQRFERANAAATGLFTGNDQSGRVTVVVNEVGHFQDVRVSVDWRSDLEPAELATAVQEAHIAAGMARMNDWGNALAEQMDSPAPQLRPLPPFHESLGAQLEEVVRRGTTPEETRAITDAIAEFLREIIASVDEATEEIARVQRAEVSGTSEGSHVRVVVSGTGDFKGIRYDETWLERAHVVNIGRETVQAQKAALRAVAGQGVAEVLASTRLGELQALARDPEALARRLRMGR